MSLAAGKGFIVGLHAGGTFKVLLKDPPQVVLAVKSAALFCDQYTASIILPDGLANNI